MPSFYDDATTLPKSQAKYSRSSSSRCAAAGGVVLDASGRL